MSHWTSGLPKLDIEPFDPRPLYRAVEESNRRRAELEARRRTRLRPLLVLGTLVAVAAAVAGLLAFLAG